MGDLIVGQLAPGADDFGLNGALGIAGGKADEMNLSQRERGRGAFRLMFCFENGAITGDGKTRELSGAFAKKYVVLNGGIASNLRSRAPLGGAAQHLVRWR